MQYKEERNFTVQLQLSASFDDSYEGDDDGYEWFRNFDGVLRPRVIRAILEALTSEPGWKVTPVSRGANQSESLEIRVERLDTKSTTQVM